MTENNEKNIWLKLVEFHVRHYILMLAIIGLGTIYFSYEAYTRLKVHTDFFQLYPPNHEYIKLYKEYRKMFGSANVLNMIVEVKEGDIYTVDTIHKIDRITKELMTIKGVNPLQIMSITHPRLKDINVGTYGVSIRPLQWPALPRNEEDLRRLKTKVYSNAGIRNIYISPDDKSTLLQAGFWEEGLDFENLFARIMDIKEREEDENHLIYITGYPMLYAWIQNYFPQLVNVFLVTTAVLTLLLIWYFRSFMGVFIPLISGVLSAVWGLGFAAALGYNLDPLVLVVPLLLSARALSHSVQSMERYHEEYARVGEKKEAIIFAYGHLYKPAILSIVTDGLGVLTIAVASIPLMRNLAIFSSFWILSIYVSSVVLHPVLVALLPPPRQKHLKAKKEGDLSVTDVQELRKITERPGDKIYMHICHGLIYLTKSWRKWAVLGITLFIFVVGGLYSINLKVGDTSAGKAILYGDHPYNIAADLLNSKFLGASQMIAIAEGKKEGAMKEADSLRVIEEMALYSQGIENCGGAVTITDLIKQFFRMFHEGDPKWAMLPEETAHLSQTFFLLGSSMAPGEMDQYVSTPEFTNATVTMYFKDYNNKVIKNAIAKLKTYIANNPVEDMRFRLAGGLLGILAAVNEEVEWSYWVNLGLIFSLTFLLCSMTFRSFLAALVLIIPLAVSQVLSEVLMLVWGIDLNINSLPVAAVGVGIGVDYGIYVVSRLAEEYKRSGEYDTARYLAITSTGKAVVFTATTLVAGVIFWVFSDFKFQAEMGTLLAFLMVANMIGALVIVPSLVSILGPQRMLHKYQA